MKIIALPVAVLLAVSVMQAQSPAPLPLPDAKPDPKVLPAKPADLKAVSADPKTVPGKTVDAKTTPGKPGVTDKTPVKKKEIVLPGVTIARPNGTFLSLEVVNAQFKLSFYDAKKKPAAIDVTRATARWPNTRSAIKAWNRAVLNPSGTSLIGSQPVLPPYVFNVYLTLLQGDGDNAKVVESYTVQMH